MDHYEGQARLEWWANRHTCLGSIDVRVTVLNDDHGWHTSAISSSPLNDEDREGWDFLMALSPYATLRFEDDEQATIDVRVDGAGEGGLILTVV
ncbi:hypothetical protein ACFY4C_31750 [Actinomadura viridis]|uniref:hypothetical protein n=1 Tax=Actinomadura viridis TaxID=58110 RepID=UPI003689B00B